MAFSAESVSPLNRFDYYYLGQVVVWALLVLSIADFYERNQRIPVAGVVLVMLVVRLMCTTCAMIVVIGAGGSQIHTSETFACLLVGWNCNHAVPATLIGHALVIFVRLCAVVVVVKYIGAPLCVVTLVTSNSLRFYRHDSFDTIDLGACLLSLLGCAVFVHGQWILETSHNAEYDDQLRRSTAPTSLFVTSSDDDQDEESPLMMQDG
jgi:hypothetical protein